MSKNHLFVCAEIESQSEDDLKFEKIKCSGEGVELLIIEDSKANRIKEALNVIKKYKGEANETKTVSG